MKRKPYPNLSDSNLSLLIFNMPRSTSNSPKIFRTRLS
ncbi:hypothetical protein HPCPY1313_0541 [Helicobacter pylori CPY1313]|nr:hypothetical protein HPCPY1313_0541 [Helicobacter pylori CPY1313]